MYRNFFKRLIDVLIALIMLIVLSPILLILAIAVKLDSKGPVVFKQQRIGLHGKVFNIYKYRSMRVGAEKIGTGVYSEKGDARVTRVGNILRKTSADELLQLVNILKGDMSLVGPRPERKVISDEYSKSIPEFVLRTKVKAGLTGYAQVYGKYNSTPQEKLQMDLLYISNPSIIEDLKLILTTIRVLFIKESTEGFAENAHPGSGNTSTGIEPEEKAPTSGHRQKEKVFF